MKSHYCLIFNICLFLLMSSSSWAAPFANQTHEYRKMMHAWEIIIPPYGTAASINLESSPDPKCELEVVWTYPVDAAGQLIFSCSRPAESQQLYLQQAKFC